MDEKGYNNLNLPYRRGTNSMVKKSKMGYRNLSAK